MKTTFVTIISRWTDNLVYQVPIEHEAAAKEQKILNDAFDITNRADRPLGRQVCGTSTGDLMMVNGKYWLVSRIGFKSLDESQAIAWQQIAADDAHMGWDWCIINSVITASGQVLRK